MLPFGKHIKKSCVVDNIFPGKWGNTGEGLALIGEGGSWGVLSGSSLAAGGEQLGQKAGVRKLWWVRVPPSGLPDCIEKKVALIHFQFLT